ncbi:MAG: TRAP transporter small permease subunit [Thalassovita sp.]
MTDKATPVFVRRALDLWHRAEVWIAVIAFSAIALILIYDVLVREAVLPLLSLMGLEGRWLVLYGSQKIAVYLLVAGAFAGIGIATWAGAQLIPKVGFKAVPARFDGLANRAADIVTFLFLMAVAVVAADFVFESFQSGQRASGGLRIEVWKVQAAIPLGFASAALRYFAFVIWPDVRPQQAEAME